MNENLLGRESDDRDRHGNAGQQDETLGDHRDNAGDRAANRIVERNLGAEDLRGKEQNADRQQHVGQDPNESTDRIAQFGVSQVELLRLLGEPGRE